METSTEAKDNHHENSWYQHDKANRPYNWNIIDLYLSISEEQDHLDAIFHLKTLTVSFLQVEESGINGEKKQNLSAT